jgi:hypothetical protein
MESTRELVAMVYDARLGSALAADATDPTLRCIR